DLFPGIYIDEKIETQSYYISNEIFDLSLYRVDILYDQKYIGFLSYTTCFNQNISSQRNMLLISCNIFTNPLFWNNIGNIIEQEDVCDNMIVRRKGLNKYLTINKFQQLTYYNTIRRIYWFQYKSSILNWLYCFTISVNKLIDYPIFLCETNAEYY